MTRPAFQSWLCYVWDEDSPDGELYVRMVYSAAEIAAFQTLCRALDRKPIIKPYEAVVRR